MSIKNLNELKRLQLIFEKEADKFKKLTFSVIYIGKGWTSQPSKSHCFEKHVVPLWQYYGRVDSKEEYDEQMEIVRNSSALEPIQGAQIYSYAGFEGDDLDYFLRIARRAGNLFSKIEALSFSTKLEKEIVEKLQGLRIHEIHGLK